MCNIKLDFSKEIHLNKIPTHEVWLNNIVSFLTEWYDNSEIIKTNTSGSTGIPKTIELTKEAMVKSAEMTGKFLNLKENDSALLCMPALYIAGKMMLVRAIVWKLKLLCIPPSSNPLKNITDEISFSAMTPMQVEHSLDKLHLIKKLIIGGAQIPAPLYKQLNQFSTNNIYESFGMTETISHIALKKVSKNPEESFKLLPNTKIDLDDRGCLTIKTPFSNEEIITNDIVKMHSENEFEWLGRLDNVINSGGIKIYPEKVEKQLKTIIPNEFIISSQPDPILGNKVILVIEGCISPYIEELIQNFNFNHKYEKPREIYFIEKFQRTPTGKIVRRNISLS
ncbi:long-chain fatty acid--CoA ligase [Apibacter muscae]|uniref:AMP-binding protein n=1 Tax=Apibacter muscae TaxID=2509004 RepID=UPI0011AC7990|nr:AMP-binding protein [Apibacter muscae]TWP24398.1 long-chain fatty acid--CoA ligase [Apibacter muscae]